MEKTIDALRQQTGFISNATGYPGDPSEVNDYPDHSSIPQSIYDALLGVTLFPEQAEKIHESVNGATHGGHRWGPISEQMPLSQVVNGIVTPAISKLLAEVLRAINASIPNKDQNRAVTGTVRDAFDRCYFSILRESWPDTDFGQTAGCHAIDPYDDKAGAVVWTKPI